MQEFTLEHYWMVGVMAVMVIFAGIAGYGYFFRHKKDTEASENDD